MATYKKGINGPFKGKLGNVVGVTWRGIEVMRSFNETSTKPASEKQLNQRYIFALVNSWLKPLRDLIWVGFQIFKGTRTPMNGAVSLLLNDAVSGNSRENYAIDFARVVLSRGELLISLVKQVLALIEGILRIEWDNPAANAFCRDDDKATIIVYNAAKQKFVTFEAIAERKDKLVELQLPANFAGDALHSWMYYVNTAGDAVSTSVYLGESVMG